ncbi:FG-GAP repeat protein [Nitrospinota bacterium]
MASRREGRPKAPGRSAHRRHGRRRVLRAGAWERPPSGQADPRILKSLGSRPARTAGRRALRWTLPLQAPVASNIAVGDFNGDGKEDLAFADERGLVRAILSR